MKLLREKTKLLNDANKLRAEADTACMKGSWSRELGLNHQQQLYEASEKIKKAMDKEKEADNLDNKALREFSDVGMCSCIDHLDEYDQTWGDLQHRANVIRLEKRLHLHHNNTIHTNEKLHIQMDIPNELDLGLTLNQKKKHSTIGLIS